MALALSPVSLLLSLVDEEQIPDAGGIARKLTDRAIKMLKPADKEYKTTDGGGLTLSIAPSGRKVWVHRYRLAGRQSDFTLGSYPDVSLSDARRLLRATSWLIARGYHPRDWLEAKQKELQAQSDAQRSFQHFATAWLDIVCPRLAKVSADIERGMFRNHVFPTLGHKPLVEVQRRDLAQLLRRLDEKHPVTAGQLRGYLRIFYEWCCDEHYIAVNPTPDASALTWHKTHRPTRRKAARVEQVPAVFAALDAAEDTGALTKIAFRLLVLCWSRTIEIVGAEWEEIDLEHGCWTIPKERMKARVEHVVWLPRQAVALLKEAAKLRDERNPRYVFPSTLGAGHMNRSTLHQCLSRLRIPGAGTEKKPVYYSHIMSIHGFRATARTWAAEHRVCEREVAEMALAHQIQSDSEAAYDRAEHWDELRALWQRWADELDAQVAAYAQRQSETPAS